MNKDDGVIARLPGRVKEREDTQVHVTVEPFSFYIKDKRSRPLLCKMGVKHAG